MDKWTKKDLDFVQDNCRKLTHKQLATQLGRTKSSIKTKCQEHGWLKKIFRHDCKDNYFDSWSANMAYILGFITADGCLSKGRNQLTFCLHHQDVEILEFIKKELKFQGNIRYKIDKRTENKFVELKISSKKLIDSLKNLGLTERKTGHEILPKIPEEYKFDYLRGLFDGDGCISIRNNKYKTPAWFICSSNKYYLENLKNQILPNIGSITKKTDKDFYYWNIWKREDIRSLATLMYLNNNFSLERKRQKMLLV